MAKIMLVEDDKSLREIYSIRLVAEGYEVVSAGDGEEALAIAVQQKPDLILSDVMMPKISGFDMLDILRSTPETKNIKVIMMTALSSDEQRQRGESLGADKYLVKSQVGIEDVINAVHEVLGDKNGAAGSESPSSTPTPALSGPQPAEPAQPAAQPEAQTAPQPTTVSAPQPAPVAAPQPAPVVAQTVPVSTQPTAAPAQPTAAPVQPMTNPVQSAPIQDTGAQMDAMLNEAGGMQSPSWPGTTNS